MQLKILGNWKKRDMEAARRQTKETYGRNRTLKKDIDYKNCFWVTLILCNIVPPEI